MQRTFSVVWYDPVSSLMRGVPCPSPWPMVTVVALIARYCGLYSR